MSKPKFTEEQKKVIVLLFALYWAAGDVKDIWYHSGDALLKDDLLKDDFDFQTLDDSEDPCVAKQLAIAFNIHTEAEILAKLDELEPIFNDIDNFTLR